MDKNTRVKGGRPRSIFRRLCQEAAETTSGGGIPDWSSHRHSVGSEAVGRKNCMGRASLVTTKP
jgi:hypothetical protein